MAEIALNHSPGNINTEHPLLKDFKGEIKEFQFGAPSVITRMDIYDFFRDSFSMDYWPDLDSKPDHNLRVATLKKAKDTSAERPGTPLKELYVYMPGAVGTPAGSAPTVAVMLEQNPDIEMGMAISSYASKDTWGKLSDAYVKNPFERASQIAGIIAETLRTNPAEKIKLDGTSMGGMDMFLAALVLQGLIDKGKLRTKIAGLVLSQPAGMYDQKSMMGIPVEFITTRKDEHQSVKRDVEHLYPSTENFADVQTALDEALAQGDAPKTMRLREQLNAMEAKKDSPRYLTEHLDESQRAELEKIESQISELQYGGSDKELKQLEHKRYQILKGVVDPKVVTGAESRVMPNGGIPDWNWIKNVVPLFITHEHGINIATQMPKNLRDLVKFPVAILMGEKDAYFKPEEQRRAIEEAGKEQFFPNAPKVMVAEVSNWSHQGAFISPEKNAEIKKDIYRRMEEVDTESRFVDLKYTS